MRTFIGIGSDHLKDVFDKVYEVLQGQSVGNVTLEYPIDVWNNGDSEGPELEKRRRILEESPVYTTLKRGKKPLIKVGDFFLYGGRSGGAPELSAGVDFALRKGMPFYFVDWSSEFPHMIAEFKDGKVCLVPMDRTHGYPKQPEEYFDETSAERTDARNRFSAHAINHVFGDNQTLAHIGGIGHFDSSFEGDLDLYQLSDGLELQNLVNAERKTVYDMVKEKVVICPTIY